jgi:hypothetical protein
MELRASTGQNPPAQVRRTQLSLRLRERVSVDMPRHPAFDAPVIACPVHHA